MEWWEVVAIVLAGGAAGMINVIVGSGTLITFPTLLAIGVPPVTANVSNTIGLVPGSVAGAVGYRRELQGQRSRILRLSMVAAAGAVVGAILLLELPPEAFEAIVPVLIGLGVLLVAAQPAISRRVARLHDDQQVRPDAWWLAPAVLLIGVYGGYFGAAIGVLLMGVLGIAVASETLQRLNGVKNVVAAATNAVAGVIFVAVADIDWLIALLIAIGATGGGVLGASVGRRLPAPVLRAVIVIVGVIAIAAFVLG